MAGRKKKPCDFCSDDNWYSEEGTPGHQLAVEIYPENNSLSVTSFANNESGESEELTVSFEMNFCPVCGRRLEY